MVDHEVVRRRLTEIDRRVSDLRAIRALGRERFLADSGLQAQSERHLLQLAIQAAIDIAIHLAAEESATPPEDYAGAFAVLQAMGVIDERLAKRLASAARLRNLLVHAYLDVDPERIWLHLDELDDLVALSRQVQRLISR